MFGSIFQSGCFGGIGLIAVKWRSKSSGHGRCFLDQHLGVKNTFLHFEIQEKNLCQRDQTVLSTVFVAVSTWEACKGIVRSSACANVEHLWHKPWTLKDTHSVKQTKLKRNTIKE